MRYHKKLQKILNLYYQEKMPAIKDIRICDSFMVINFVNYRIRGIWKYDTRFWTLLENMR